MFVEEEATWPRRWAAGKDFAFLGEKADRCGLRLKLDASLPEVSIRSGDAPEQYEVGTSGWVMLRFGADDQPSVDDLERWIVESYSLLAPKRLLTMLPTPPTPSA